MGYSCLTFPSRSLGREPVNKETDEEIPEEGEYRINEPIKKGPFGNMSVIHRGGFSSGARSAPEK